MQLPPSRRLAVFAERGMGQALGERQCQVRCESAGTERECLACVAPWACAVRALVEGGGPGAVRVPGQKQSASRGGGARRCESAWPE